MQQTVEQDHAPQRIAAIRYLALAVVLILVGTDAARAGTPDPLARPDTVTMNEVSAGELLFHTDEPGRFSPALHLDSEADITISGIVAVVELTQRFRNTTRDWVEGVYAFPLPETAAVNAMELRIGKRVIVGEIREKAQARRDYERAKSTGKKSALVEQRRPNLFATAVANVAPGEDVEVRLTYVEKVSYDTGRFSLRFPMTVTPRYIPGAPLSQDEPASPQAPGSGWSGPTDQVPDADQITPFLSPVASPGSHRIELRVSVTPGLPLAEITSAYHQVHVIRQSDTYAVELAAGSVPMDRDFELSWRPVVGAMPAVSLLTERLDGATYALAMIMPPAQDKTTARLARELVFIIDTSGSMGGEPIRQARAALDHALSRIGPDDTINVIAFDDRPTPLFRSPVRADAAAIRDARRFVRGLRAGGGTEMSSALRAAFSGEAESSAGRLRQTVFITDGAVGNEEALFRQIAVELGDRRLFTVGIGSAPNRYFMRKAAEFGRGTFTHIGAQADVESRMDALLTRLEHPMLRNVAVTLPDPGASFAPDPIPDLYAGQPIVVTARLRRTGGAALFSGSTVDGEWRRSLPLSSGRSHRGIATLWARDHIAGLEDEIALRGESDGLRARILDTALAHRLVSRYTSFVAIERRITRPDAARHRSHDVPNLRPAGQSPQPFAYPQTATSATQAFWLGLLGFLATLMLWQRVFSTGRRPA